MRRLAVLLVAVAACSGGSHTDDLYREYLRVEGFTAVDAPVDAEHIADLTDSLCEMEGVRLGAYLDNSGGRGSDRRLEQGLVTIQCPDQAHKFR